MRARDHLHKALLLLDRGRLDRGEQVLSEAITAAREEPDPVTLVTALACLGELLSQTNRPEEAASTLRECLSVPIPPPLDDTCETPRTRARTLLTTLP
ncbi:hypothetical protein [Actinophytocola sp. KF-1]